MSKPLVFQLLPAENGRLSQLCGQLNSHIQQIEQHLNVKITQRNNAFSITGTETAKRKAESVVRDLFEITGQKKIPYRTAMSILPCLAVMAMELSVISL
ncbi:MAG: hypothetical protein GKR95_25985 [Gammaproteobacteria bacterium]|nr:hypothetical protein [Gammaproteobacteria bacterium]NKB65401.1 hypothetical protein [Gammaproteobacteria bacterium]